MALIDIRINPSRKELIVFSFLWLIFFALLARLAFWSPTTLLYAAGVTGLCFLTSIVINAEQPRRAQLMGVAIPLTLLMIGGLERFLGVPPRVIAGASIAVGATGCIVTLVSSKVGTRLYTGWMYAALPIGWTISHALLALIYYAVLTPIGLVMRLLGNDPMQRRLDRAATTYWSEHRPPTDPKRYFRQF
ncbi:MAG: hypothetical protein FJ255_05885 [Phycisphaerae bacterium]|nr:hypothetical protein [Phycisphaerae bacterium]